MKQTIFIISILCITWKSQFAKEPQEIGQDYHLIYIELSNNNNRMGLMNQLNYLYKTLLDNGDVFVSFLSNADNGSFYESDTYLENMFFLIRDLNISLPNAEFDLRKIIEFWNENDITYLDEQNFTYLKFNNLYIHYFVSPSYYSLSGEQFSYKLLNVNNLNSINKNAKQIHLKFYFNQDDTHEVFLGILDQQRESRNNNPYGFEYEIY